MADPILENTGQLEIETASLWRAMADPTRRRILDLLRAGPAITGEIAAAFPISRIAVMRHLEVLAEADLITSRTRGRERWHYLNSVPLERLHRRWAGPAEAGFASTLLRLQNQVEAERGALDLSRPAVDVALDVVVAGSRQAEFEAITERIGEWWGYPAVDERATRVSLEPLVGGRFVEHWGESGGQLIATVTALEPNRRVRLTGSFHFGLVLGDATFDLEDAVGGTLLRFSFRAMGAIDPAMIEDIQSGWTSLVASRLKALVEFGSPEGAVAAESNMRVIGTRRARPGASGSPGRGR
jgi:DNA-binding transcriptional ArsR family regulator